MQARNQCSIYYSLSKVLNGQYEMNRCPHCKAKIGNFYVEEFHLDNEDLFFGVEFIHNIHHVDFNPRIVTLRTYCSFTCLPSRDSRRSENCCGIVNEGLWAIHQRGLLSQSQN
jgi:hypothetical protein